MKKKLLLLGATLLMGISASAQDFTANWEKPAPPTFSTWSAETEFYLWNVGAGGFYTCYQEGGNTAPYWNTRASVNDTFGNLVNFTQFNPSGTDETEIFSWCEANDYKNVYLFTSYVNTRGFNRFMCTFSGGFDDIWTDNDGRQDRYWRVSQSGNYIKIEGGPKDIMFSAEDRAAEETGDKTLYDYTGKYLGVRANNADRVLFLKDLDRLDPDEEFYDEWAVVDPADYETYMENSKDQAERVAAAASLRAAIEAAYEEVFDINLDAQIAVYNNTSSTLDELQAAEALVKAIVALGKDIQKAQEDYPGIDLSTIIAVYKNTASTVADLEKAQQDMIPIILDFAAKNATPENPVNFSASIVNSTFDVIGDFHGWSGDAFGAGGTTSTCAEHYGHNYNTYQDIDLTGYPGVYAVKVKGYVRKTSPENAWALHEEGQDDSEASLYISSTSFGEMSTPIKNIAVGALTTDPANGTSAVVSNLDGQTYYMPNVMKSATDSYFVLDPCPYQVSVINAVKDGEKLRIGVRNQNMGGSDWSCFDDFELWYYGNSAEAYTAIKETLLETATLDIPEDAHYGQPDLDAFNNAVNNLKAAADAEAIAAAVKAVDEAKKNFEKSKTAYAAYLAQVEAAEKWLLDSDAAGDDADKLADYLQTSAIDNDDMADYEFPNGVANYIIDLEHNAVAGKLTAAEIETETAYLTDLLQTAIRNSMVPGQDVTYLLKNPAFDGNFDGWTYAAGKLGNHNVECYQSIVDVYQVVEGVPAGIYAISAQAFERPGGNGSFNGTEEPRVFLFMNEFKTPVQNICADGITNDKAVDQVNCLIGDGSGAWPNDYYQNDEVGWIPNSVDGAYYAFSAGRYDQECYGLVGDDGVMKIGLTSNGKTIEWVLWANFRLTYMGKDKTAMQSIIADFSERVVTINDQISAGDIVVGDPEMGALETAKTEALKAKDDETMYQALMTLVSAYNTVLTSADLYKEVDKLYEYYLDKIYSEDFGEVGDDKAVKDALDYFETVFQNITLNHTMSNAEVQEAIEKMAALYAEALVPSNIDQATPENPVELAIIQNATFDNAVSNNDFSGWTRLSGDKGFGTGGTVANCAEVWTGTFDICQDVKVSRQGTYKLTVNGMTRMATNSTNYTAWKNGEKTTAYFYAQTKTAQVSVNVKNSCDGGRETDDLGGTQLGTDEEPCYVPNSMAAFDSYIHGDDEWTPRDDNPYLNELIINVTEADDDMIIRIGVKKDVVTNDDWAIFDDFKIYYLGVDGAANSGDALPVESISTSEKAAVVAVYTVGGTRLATLQRGINIVRMSDGSVRKIIVK